MKSWNNIDPSDPSSMIMRNPYESMSGSRKSSKFGQYQNYDIAIPEFTGDRQYNIKQKHTANNRLNSQMQGHKQISQKNIQALSEKNIQCGRNQKSRNVKEPPNSSQQISYPQRLTFQRQNPPPNFNRIPSNPTKNSQQHQQRHSFNPLQNRINEIQKMCKNLYQININNSKKQQNQRQNLMRIQKKINFIIECMRNDNKFERNRQKENAQKEYKYNLKQECNYYDQGQQQQTKQMKSQQSLNSSQKLSRYLQPSESTSKTNMTLTIDKQNSYYNRSKTITSNHTKRVKPFLASSQLHNQSSIPYNQNNNIQNNTIEFSQYYDIQQHRYRKLQQNKQNIDSNNMIDRLRSNKNNIKQMMKKNNRSHTHQTNGKKMGSNLRKCKVNTDQTNRKQMICQVNGSKSSQKYNISKQNIKASRPKQQSNRKINKKKVNQQQEEVMKIRLRAKSQKLAKNNSKKGQIGSLLNRQIKYYKQMQQPYDRYDQNRFVGDVLYGNQFKDKNNGKQNIMMQNSQIFKNVEFNFQKNQRQVNLGSREQKVVNFQGQKISLNNKINRKVKQTQFNRHNKTLLQSIQQKRRIIDQEIVRRLQKNSSILYEVPTNYISQY